MILLSVKVIKKVDFSVPQRKPSLKPSMQRMGHSWSFLGEVRKTRVIRLLSFNLKAWNVSGMITNCCYFYNKCLSQSHKNIGSVHTGISLVACLDVPVELVWKVMKNHGHFERIHTNSTDSSEARTNVSALDVLPHQKISRLEWIP